MHVQQRRARMHVTLDEEELELNVTKSKPKRRLAPATQTTTFFCEGYFIACLLPQMNVEAVLNGGS